MDNQINSAENKRGNLRYETQAKVYFQFAYDVETKVKFQLFDLKHKKSESKKYSGSGKNISVEGLGFTSPKQLHQGDTLDLEVYLPEDNHPIHMQGEVRWSEKKSSRRFFHSDFETGVKLISIEGKPVQNSIRFDQAYQVYWSDVLESVLGKYRILSQKRHNADSRQETQE